MVRAEKRAKVVSPPHSCSKHCGVAVSDNGEFHGGSSEQNDASLRISLSNINSGTCAVMVMCLRWIESVRRRETKGYRLVERVMDTHEYNHQKKRHVFSLLETHEYQLQKKRRVSIYH